jgi:TrmH family RNA methyltransferase
LIPPHKLAKLPLSLRLRKTARIFAESETRLAAARLSAGEISCLAAILEPLLVENAGFSPAALSALHEVYKTLKEENSPPESSRRALNTVRHVLLMETGRSPADWDFLDPEGALDPAKRRPFPGMQVYLEDIRSPFNVGSLFRSAESFGAEKMWLSPLCADPRHPRAERSAMGCVSVLPWERVQFPPFPECPLFALETGGTDIDHFAFPRRGLMIVGSEELGVSPEALAAADASLGRVSIPTRGAKGSLNVSVAFGIVMRAWAQHMHPKG